MLKRIKYNTIHELSSQESRALLNQACRKCVTKTGINTSQDFGSMLVRVKDKIENRVENKISSKYVNLM